MTKHKGVLSWAMYDWANSAFTTTVMAGFFPVFFKDFWSKGSSPTVSTFWLGLSVSIASLIIVVLAPMLGAMADIGAAKKRSLGLFVAIGIVATAGFYFIGEGSWPMAAAMYVVSSVGFLGANIFYDSLIVSVSTEETVDLVSAYGYSLGYLGGGLLFLINVLMVQNPVFFGLSSAPQAVQVSFLTVAFWWAIFSIPLFLNVAEPIGGQKIGIVQAARKGSKQLLKTFHEVRKMRILALFLLSYWLYIDGVHTVITMAVDYGKSVGFETSALITALLLAQFVGFPATYLSGYLGQRFGSKPVIAFSIFVYICVTFLSSQIDLVPYKIFGLKISKFYLVALLVAMVQGGVQSLSRSFYSRLIPKGKEAEFFGFYNMLGKFASVVGPLLMGTVGRVTGNPRLGIQSVAILLVAGLVLLWQVDLAKGHKLAESME